MVNKHLDSFKEQWVKLTPGARTAIAAVGILVVVMAFGSLFFKDLKPITRRAALSSSDLMLPGIQGDVTNEVLASKIDALIQAQAALSRNQQAAQEDLSKMKQQMSNPAEIQQLQQQVSQLQSQQRVAPPPVPASVPPKPVDPLADPALNLPLNQAPAQTFSNKPVSVAPVPSIRVLGGDDSKTAEEEKAAAEEETIIPYLPSGSMFYGVLLNGLEAPTSQVTMKNPVPAFLRIKSDAILPNEYRKDVRECFMLVSGYGVLSTERAQLRTESISCVRKDGGVIESRVNGYVVGEDGKVGMRGRLVSRQGQLIAQSLMVGFVQGIGSAMQPMAVPAMNLSPMNGSSQMYQMPSMSMMAMSGLAGGVSNAANSIAQFYLSMAQQMFPVVEIDAGRKVTVMLTKGFKFDLSGKYNKKTQTIQPVSVQQGPVQPATVPMTPPPKVLSGNPGVPMNQVGTPQGTNPAVPQMQYAQ